MEEVGYFHVPNSVAHQAGEAFISKTQAVVAKQEQAFEKNRKHKMLNVKWTITQSSSVE